jgi:putative long chain acyl-CoA synthase
VARSAILTEASVVGDDVRVPLLANPITRRVTRLGVAAQNALEVARFGGLTTEDEPSPYEVVSAQRVYRLRRYYADRADGPPIVRVPRMMLAAEVYDVSPATSAVTILRQNGPYAAC